MTCLGTVFGGMAELMTWSVVEGLGMMMGCTFFTSGDWVGREREDGARGWEGAEHGRYRA